jgi:hypothetical protein
MQKLTIKKQNYMKEENDEKEKGVGSIKFACKKCK